MASVVLRVPFVLIVDDEPDHCAALELWLQRAGCDVVSVSSGAEALEELGAADFDAVLTDIAMKEMISSIGSTS